MARLGPRADQQQRVHLSALMTFPRSTDIWCESPSQARAPGCFQNVTSASDEQFGLLFPLHSTVDRAIEPNFGGIL